MTLTGTRIARFIPSNLEGVVYALHAFQKNSKAGKATDKTDLEMIDRRLKLAREDHEERKRENDNG